VLALSFALTYAFAWEDGPNYGFLNDGVHSVFEDYLVGVYSGWWYGKQRRLFLEYRRLYWNTSSHPLGISLA
jgi:hypothetical protein